jgi:hypothetical protein
MATINLNPTAASVDFTRGEKLAGLLRDIEVPLTCVREVAVERDGLQAARGVRAPGPAIPGLRKVGTWRGKGCRTAVSVRRDQPVLRLTLDGHTYSELLVGLDDADQVASRLRGATRRS